jgi:dihydroorotase
MTAAQTLLAPPREPAGLLLRDVRVLDPREQLDDRLDVRVSAGRIAELADPGTLADTPGEQTIEGEGRVLLVPAFFDPHVHLRTPGQEHKEDIESGTRAAAAGGYCGVIAMPNTAPTLDSVPVLESVQEVARRDAHIPVGFLAAVTQGLESEQRTDMAALRRAGVLGFTNDGRPVATAGTLLDAIERQQDCGGVLALHEEDLSLSRGGAMNEGSLSRELGLPGIPTIAESTMLARDAQIAAYAHGRLHFMHLSAAASVEAVAEAKGRGAALSAEVSPHHLLLTEEDVRGLDTSMKMHPPLTSEQDRQALIEGLRAGAIDCIATDHAPHSPAEKAVPFAQAPMGTTGLETAFAALHTGLVLPGTIDLSLLIERMTAGAELFGLPAPRIAAEAPANVTLIDPTARWVAGENGWQSRSENCCFTGRHMTGRVLMTIAAGGVAHRDSALAPVQEASV